MLILAVVAILLISWGCYWVAFYNPEYRHKEPVPLTGGWRSEEDGPKLRALYAQMDALPCEQVFIRTHDGLRLGADYYHQNTGALVQLQFHGYRGSGVRDLCGLHKLAREMGHNTLVVSQRANGASEGNTITYGIKERFDCLQWAKYAAERFGEDTPIVLAGVSMGAATVLMASDLELPENVIGIIADCPYATPGSIIRKVSRDMHLPGWVSYPFITLGALIFGRFCLWEWSPLEAVKGAKVPILLIHGEADRFVPPEMSERIRNCAGELATMVTFPGAAHGTSYISDPQRYENAVVGFLKKCRQRWEENRTGK